jgi:peptidoglycan/xylan/chitin deacetylase (PgdA/CDA1 family)
MIHRFKASLSKLNFILKRNPKIVKIKDIDLRKYIPEPFKGVFILSADFELAWAWRYAKSFKNPKEKAKKFAKISRKNIPKILDFCSEYNIPITWATIGHLLLEKCSHNEKLAHSHLRRIPHHENKYWKFNTGDWFEDDPGNNWHVTPEWYAPDLVREIMNSSIRHEIACHTFSHIDCQDGICPPEVFKDEINECLKAAKKWGIELKSFVYPGNLVGNLGLLRDLGFTSYRTDFSNLLSFPRKDEYGLWEMPSTAELAYRKEWSLDYHIWRYKKIVDRAINYGRICSFWFHPSCDERVIDLIFPYFFEYISNLNNKGLLLVTTISDYIDYVEKNEQK